MVLSGDEAAGCSGPGLSSDGALGRDIRSVSVV